MDADAMTWLQTAWISTTAAGAQADINSPNARQTVGQALGLALQGDVVGALAALATGSAERLRGEDLAFRTCMRQRFGRPVDQTTAAPGIDSAFVHGVLLAYRSYWHASLLRPAQRKSIEEDLLKTLRLLLGHDDTSDFEDISSALTLRLGQAGYHVLLGRTPPLLELMLWSRQDIKQFSVELPESTYQVQVALLNDFVSMGWSHYATCGWRSTGGWASKDTLYAVTPRYPGLESEEFRVSFLAHEAQHMADFRHFDALMPWELEFRAKLTELALAMRTRHSLLAKFIENRGMDPAIPHAYANQRVMSGLLDLLGLAQSEADALFEIDEAALQTVARELLGADTARRRNDNQNAAVSQTP